MASTLKRHLVIGVLVSGLMLTAGPAQATSYCGWNGTGAAAYDADHDGLPDSWERQYGMSVRVDQAHTDIDRDGLDNLAEYRSGTHPRRPDTDADGIPDRAEDPDRDHLSNLAEVRARTHPRRADTDRDGRPDGWEDPDLDGLNLIQEIAARTHGLRLDTDRDGIRDPWDDTDRDGIRNRYEFMLGTNPARPDTDGDGIPDGRELAGRIASFDPTTGVLAIQRYGMRLGTWGVATTMTIDSETRLLWAHAPATSTATLSDLIPGRMVHSVDTTRASDGSLVAQTVVLAGAQTMGPYDPAWAVGGPACWSDAWGDWMHWGQTGGTPPTPWTPPSGGTTLPPCHTAGSPPLAI